MSPRADAGEDPAQWRQRRVPASWGLGALAAFVLLAGELSLHGFLGDVGWDVANGLWILNHGYVPLRNYLSQAMYGAPWTNAEWLFGLYAGWAYTVLGRLGVYISLLPVLGGTALLLAAPARRLGPYWDVLWPLAAALTIMPVMNPRPQLFSFLLFAFALWAVGRLRQGDARWLWPAALSSALWTNLHGSAVLLPLVLFLEIAFGGAESRRRLVLPFAISLVLLAAHPGGILGTAANLTHEGSQGNVNVIAEWSSPNFHTPGSWPALAAMFAGLSLLLPALWRSRRFPDAILLVGSALAMLYSVRFLPYLMLVLAMRGPEHIPTRLTLQGDGPGRRSLLLGALPALVLAAGFARYPVFPPRYPLHAFRWLRAHHAQDVFNWYSIGSSLEVFGIRPYLDGRANLWLQRPFWPHYLAVSFGEESPTAYLRRYDPHARYVLWYLRSPVGIALDRSPHWRRVLVDPNLSDPQRATLGPYAVWERVTR